MPYPLPVPPGQAPRSNDRALDRIREGNKMSRRFKALGLGLFVAVVVSAVGVVGASAEVTGHFTVEVDDAVLEGTEEGAHNSQFSVDGGTPIECVSDSYDGNAGAETLAGFTLTPEYPTCKTEGAATHNITITMNGCDYTLKSTSGTHATFWIQCPLGKAIEIHHPNCTITIPSDKTLTGASYTTVLEDGKHALTVNLTVSMKANYHGGICVFLGTSHQGAMSGSFTLQAFGADGKAVDLTVT